MAKRFPLNPQHPERLCWGCDAYCPEGDLRCGNGAERSPHPAELWGADWALWGETAADAPAAEPRAATPPAVLPAATSPPSVLPASAKP